MTNERRQRIIRITAYHLLVLVCGFLLVPLGLSFAFALGTKTLAVKILVCVAILAGGSACGWFIGAFRWIPAGFWPRYGLMLALTVAPGLTVISGMLTAGGSLHGAWALSVAFSPGFLPALLIEDFTTGLCISPLMPVLYAFSFCAGFILRMRRKGDALPMPGWVSSLAVLLVAGMAASGGFLLWQREQAYVPKSHNFAYAGGFSSTDLRPYERHRPDNILPALAAPATFRVEEKKNMPILDGAEAAFPVYAAFANVCYGNLLAPPSEAPAPESTYPDQYIPNPYQDIVTFTNTIHAFHRLLRKDIDIFFGAEPSAEQRQLAADRGEVLVLTPIGKEAFVFFVGENNPVNSLTADQLRAIYSGRIRNWQELGGPDLRIMAFQRPANSGSQTVMEKFMGATPLMQPLKQERKASMGGIVDATADYRSMPGALGYSFRFFVTRMDDASKVRLVALNGVLPEPEHIRSGTYPVVIPLYAITLKSNDKPEVRAFLDWMQGPQGQEIVEEVGYIRWKQGDGD